MSPILLVGFVVFAVASSITAGPNNLMMMASGVNYGVRRTLPHIAGVCLGFGAMTFLVGLGLAMLIARWHWLYVAARWAAGAWVLFHAYRMAMAKGVGSAVTGGKPESVFSAAAFQWVNPRAWATVLAAVTVYGQPDRLARDAAIMAFIFAAILIPCSLAWTARGVAIKRFLKRGRTLSLFYGATAALLAISLYPLLIEPLGPPARPPQGVILGAPRAAA